MFFSSYTIFLVSMLWSVILGMMTSSIFSIWIFAEINFFMFLLYMKMSNFFFQEIVLYFFIQVLGSTNLVFAMLTISVNNYLNLFLVLILIYKMGIAPFQNWYFNMLNSISWQAIWILTVWLKVLYLKILTLINSMVLNFIVILNVTVACISLFKEKMLKTLIGMSSLFNMAWLLISLKLNNVWVIYLTLYSFNLAMLISFFKESHLTTITPTNLKFKSNLKEMSIAMILFMVGIPPFSGFLLKLLILSNLTNFSFITSTFLLISSIIFMYFYIMMYFYLTTQSSPKINLYNNNKFLWMKITTMNFLVAPVTLFLMTYYLNNKYKKMLIK